MPCDVQPLHLLLALASIETNLCCHTVEQTVSANQEIHNYYEEVSTHIKYKLTEHKGLTSAWQQQQHAAAAVQAAEAAVLASLNEVWCPYAAEIHLHITGPDHIDCG